MLSPKYLGNEMTMAVKKKMSGLLYSWKVGLPGEPKINDAYNMLKEQGLVFDESAPKDPVSVLHNCTGYQLAEILLRQALNSCLHNVVLCSYLP